LSVDELEIRSATMLVRRILGRVSKVPFLTIALMTFSVLYFFTLRNPPPNKFLEWVLSPIIHRDEVHIAGNLEGIAIAGCLVELWVARSYRERCELFLMAYAISMGMSSARWRYFGEPSIGLSLCIFLFLAFALYHYCVSTQTLRGFQKVAPVGIGFLFGYLVVQFVSDWLLNGFSQAVNTDWQHFFAVLFGLAAMYLFQYNKKKQTA